MQFRAHLSPTSHIHREWRGAGRGVASLGGVVFRWHESAYYSDVLQADDVAELQNHPYVVMEIVGKPPAYLMDAIQPPPTIEGHAEPVAEPFDPMLEELTNPVKKRGRKPKPPDPLRVHRA